MVPERQVREILEAKMEASTYTANGICAKELEDELMKYTAKSEDYKADELLVQQTKEVQMNNDVEIDITKCTKSVGTQLVETECQDTTENSSSFDGSDCVGDDVDTLGDSEALSNFHGDAAPEPGLDGFGEMNRTRKKKTTAHWRSFIEPLMWRCKWVELQIKKLQSQALQYDRELEACDKLKKNQLEKPTPEGHVARSLPFSQDNSKNDILRRKKRKQAEATMDVATYMSRHNLFSYYENRKGFTCGGPRTDNDLKNPATLKTDLGDEFWINEEPFLSEFQDGGSSLEHILRKIELLQSQVGTLRSRVDWVISENAGKFSDMDGSLSDMDIMPAGTYIANQLISEYNMANPLVPGNAVKSHGSVVHEGNRSISSSVAVSDFQNVEDGVLIDNQRVKEEMNNLSDVAINPIQRPMVIKDESGDPSPSVVAEPDKPTENQPPPKTRSISKITTATTSKRKKRGRRTSGRWGRRSTG